MPDLVERSGPFIRTTEGRWRDLFGDADAISEGGVKDERGGRVWYGTTSLILGLPVETPVEEHLGVLGGEQGVIQVRVLVKQGGQEMEEVPADDAGAAGRVPGREVQVLPRQAAAGARGLTDARRTLRVNGLQAAEGLGGFAALRSPAEGGLRRKKPPAA